MHVEKASLLVGKKSFRLLLLQLLQFFKDKREQTRQDKTLIKEGSDAFKRIRNSKNNYFLY